jgi:chemotaxis protein histidine kinase CheA
MIEQLASQPQVPRVDQPAESNAAETEVQKKTPLKIEEVQDAPIEKISTPKRPVTAPVKNSTPHESDDHKEEPVGKKMEQLHKKAEEAKRKQVEAKHKQEQEQKKKEEKAAEIKKKDEETKAKEASKKAAADEKKAKELAEKKAKELATKQAKEQAAKLAKEDKAKKAEEAKATKLEASKKEAVKKRPEDTKKDSPPLSARRHHEPKHPEPKRPAEEPAEEAKVEEQPAPVVEVEVADAQSPVGGEREAKLAKIEEGFAQLRQNYDESQLTMETPFDISVGAKSALSLMNSMGPEKLYLDTYPPSKIVWAHRLFFQFRGISLAEDEHEAWDSIKVYLAEASKGNFGMC